MRTYLGTPSFVEGSASVKVPYTTVARYAIAQRASGNSNGNYVVACTGAGDGTINIKVNDPNYNGSSEFFFIIYFSAD